MAVHKWDVVPKYFCSVCGDVARCSPESGTRWGCGTCNTCTEDLLSGFNRIDPQLNKMCDPTGEVTAAVARLKHYYDTDIRVSPVLLIADFETLAKAYLVLVD